MKVFGITGPSSKSGKTTIVCQIIRHLQGVKSVGAVKWKCAGISSPRILTQQEDIFPPGKDTTRFRDAGAKGVFWVFSPPGKHNQALENVKKLAEKEGISCLLLEGGRAVFELTPFYLYTFSLKVPLKQWKPNWQEKLKQATVCSTDTPQNQIEEWRIHFSLSLPPLWRGLKDAIWDTYIYPYL